MASDLTLYLDDEPGELAHVGDVLGKAGVNIAGLCALTSGGGQAEFGMRWCRIPRPRSKQLAGGRNQGRGGRR